MWYDEMNAFMTGLTVVGSNGEPISQNVRFPGRVKRALARTNAGPRKRVRFNDELAIVPSYVGATQGKNILLTTT